MTGNEQAEQAGLPAPAPAPAGDPYPTAAALHEACRDVFHELVTLRRGTTGDRMFYGPRDQRRPDADALQNAGQQLQEIVLAPAHAAASPATAAQTLAGCAHAGQVLLDNLAAERKNAPVFTGQLQRLITAATRTAGRAAATAAAGLPAAAPVPAAAPAPAQPAPPAEGTLFDERQPGEPASPAPAGAIVDVAPDAATDWPPGHPHTAQLHVMITAFHNDTGPAAAAIRGSIQARDRQNYDIGFAAWARSYLSRTATAAIRAAAAASAPPPDWARPFLDDPSLTAAMTSTAAARIWNHPGSGRAPAGERPPNRSPPRPPARPPPQDSAEPPALGGEQGAAAPAAPVPAGSPPPAPPAVPDGQPPKPGHGIARVEVLHGHTSFDTAFEVSDYPCSWQLRCTARYWLETGERNPYKGQVRLKRRTTDPKNGDSWNKPHNESNFYPWAVMYRNADGHVKLHATGSWGPDPELDALIRLDGTYDQLNPDERAAYDRELKRSLRANTRGWDDWRKALEFIRGYRDSNGTLPDAAQVKDTPGFYLRDPEIRIALAAVTAGLGGPHAAPAGAAEQPAARPEAATPAQTGTPSAGPQDISSASHPAPAPGRDRAASGPAGSRNCAAGRRSRRRGSAAVRPGRRRPRRCHRAGPSGATPAGQPRPAGTVRQHRKVAEPAGCTGRMAHRERAAAPARCRRHDMGRRVPARHLLRCRTARGHRLPAPVG